MTSKKSPKKLVAIPDLNERLRERGYRK